MKIEIEETIKDQLVNQPKELREVILNFNWDTLVEEVGKKYQLDEEKIFKLQMETAIVLLGLADEEKYKENIKEYIGIDEKKTTNIINEITEKIFTPMLNTIRKNIKKDFKNRKTSWDQNLNFILSGGDYSFFLNNPNPTQNFPLEGSSNLKSEENKFKNLEDIKSKFTI